MGLGLGDRMLVDLHVCCVVRLGEFSLLLLLLHHFGVFEIALFLFEEDS